jgi:hypothetical protein
MSKGRLTKRSGGFLRLLRADVSCQSTIICALELPCIDCSAECPQDKIRSPLALSQNYGSLATGSIIAGGSCSTGVEREKSVTVTVLCCKDSGSKRILGVKSRQKLLNPLETAHFEG